MRALLPDSAPMSPGATLAGLLLLFVAGLLPFADTFLEHYPDERNYTNGAITMVQTGDYLTPRWPDGHPRFNKPVVTYWVIAASYALFGISLPASRVPFVVAGALVVALTYWTARRLSGRRETALLAAVITLSQTQLLFASIRAIPDVLLCLFMLLSAYGFLSLIVLDRRTPDAYWSAYLGAALAVATKGLLPLAFVAFAWLFVRLDRGGPPGRARDLFHWPSMLVALLIAGAWYAAVYGAHGDISIRAFSEDQVTRKAEPLGVTPLWRIPAYVGMLLTNLLPWSLLLIPLARRDWRSLIGSDPRERRAQRFIIAWSLLIAVIFGLSIKIEPRYLLPAGPLTAIVMAGVLERAAPRLVARALGFLLGATLVAIAVSGIVVALLHLSLAGTTTAILVLALYAAVAAIIVLATRAGGLSSPTALALAVFLAFPLGAITVTPAVQPDAGVEAMARDVERAPRGRPVLVASHEWLAAKLRILTGGRIPIDSWSRLGPARESWPAVMILPAPEAAGVDLKGYRTREVATEVRSVSVSALLQAIAAGHAREYLDAGRNRYIVAIRRPGG